MNRVVSNRDGMNKGDIMLIGMKYETIRGGYIVPA